MSNRNIPRLSEEELSAVKRRIVGRSGVDRHAVQTNSCMTPGKTLQLGARRLIGNPVANPDSSPTLQSFFVPGILPGQNVILGRATRWLYRKEKKLWEAKALLAIRDARLSPMARVHITWGWIERNARRDPDNFTGLSRKFLLDAMVESGVLSDDGWNEIAGWSDVWHVEKDNPGVRITLQLTS